MIEDSIVWTCLRRSRWIRKNGQLEKYAHYEQKKNINRRFLFK